jgi:hypothetical protein
MRTALILALVLAALPTLAAETPKAPDPPPADKTATPAPPSPPPVTWIVEGYKAVGYQWVKQPDHCLKTTDLKQADDYEYEISRFQDWVARTNIPAPCSKTPNKFTSPTVMATPPCPDVSFTVWAFHLIDGKWVKDEKYCWETGCYYTCRPDALAYAAKINAVSGWRATTNAPEAVYAHQNEPVPFHGPLGWGSGGGHYARGGRTRGWDQEFWDRQSEIDRNYWDSYNMNRSIEESNRSTQDAMNAMQQGIDMMNQALQNTTPP